MPSTFKNIDEEMLRSTIDKLQSAFQYDLKLRFIRDNVISFYLKELTLKDFFDMKIYHAHACQIDWLNTQFFCKNEMEFFSTVLPNYQHERTIFFQETPESQNYYAELLMQRLSNPEGAKDAFKLRKIGLVRLSSHHEKSEHLWPYLELSIDEAVNLENFWYSCFESNADESMTITAYADARCDFILRQELMGSLAYQVNNQHFKI